MFAISAETAILVSILIALACLISLIIWVAVVAITEGESAVGWLIASLLVGPSVAFILWACHRLGRNARRGREKRAEMERRREDHFLKAQIVAELYRLTNERKLTQRSADVVIGISQREVSRLFEGHFREYSIERLIGFLTAFDQDVEIVVRPRSTPRPKTRGSVTFRPAKPTGTGAENVLLP